MYPVFIEEDGKTYAVENEAGVGFINQPMEGQLKIVKTSSDGVVEGFSFQITGPNGYSVTMKTNENGEIFLDDLRIGEYTVSEILDEASESYIIPEDTLASVQENMMTVVKMNNKQIQGRITLTKVDADYPENKLSGAVFEVYADANGNGTLEEEDVLVGALTEKETGVYEMTDLPYGSYLVKETQAPEGFLLDTGLYPVRIQEDGETVTVENQAGIGFINQPMEGQLKIVKTSSDGIVEGFSFQVTGPNGYSVTMKTNENGEIFLEGLRIGEYIISEISDDASASYILPEDKLASVQENSVTIVEMHNEKQPQDVPKTGDQTNLIFWILLLGTAAAGAGICLAAYYGKHDARDD